MDCGWQNPGGAANNCLEGLAILASKPTHIAHAVPSQTTGIAEFPCRFAMTISLSANFQQALAKL
jgi:hypothetical protein